MCGIVGIMSSNKVCERLIKGLKRLEYRGYDSTGIAVIHHVKIERRRAEGKLINLISALKTDPLDGTIGIGHTRWATHGKIVVDNAHPMADENVAVVHNGIIENFATLKTDLQSQGCVFTSHTDTEVVMHLVSQNLKHGLLPLEAVQEAIQKIKGAYALVFLFKNHNNMLIAARKGSPLVVGKKEDELFVGSDAIALSSWVDSLIYLDEGDIACLQLRDGKSDIQIFNGDKKNVIRPIHKNTMTNTAISKGEFAHFMLKEIFEQPLTTSDTLQSLISIETATYHPVLKQFPLNFKRLRIIACGTSYYAGLIGKYWIERYGKMPVDVEIASEFRYRSPVFTGDTLNIFITQSGETIDTLSALHLVKEHNETTLAIVNVPESSIARHCDYVFQTMAGPEIGVASTKAFTAQLCVLAAICLRISLEKGLMSAEYHQEIIEGFSKLPGLISELLRQDHVYQNIAMFLSQKQHALFLGRGINYPVALEGALKLKELSYIHAEGYPAGELKHGPIALIDQQMPVIVIAPDDEWFNKTLSNIQEILARGAQVIILTNEEGEKKINDQIQDFSYKILIKISKIHDFLSPILYTIPIQLLAYYTAHMKGTDVDQPRNLAKSVTVE